MKTVIAEKPSVAREIAQLLGANQKKDGFMEGNGFYVTWAIGHLVSLSMPQDYGFIGFHTKQLPILPDPFLLTVRKVKKQKGYVDDSGAVKQLKIIQKLFSLCDSIVVATDAGREGELIFRYIYQYLKCSKPFERLWISSLTEKAIRVGFNSLRPGQDFDNLYHAASCRSQADWLVGINASQALSITAGNEVYSIGRVQTPTLSIICDRYLENQRFVVKKFWQVELQHCINSLPFISRSKIRFDNLDDAKDAVASVQRKGSCEIEGANTKVTNEKPPLLYNLTGLQKDANKRWRFTAEQTLNIAQSLYEKKFITYPRTGSKFISDDLWPEIPILVRELGKRASCYEPVERMKFARYNKHIVNDLGITDHHGIIVTDKIPSSLTAEEDKIYDMIALRLLEALSQPCVKEIMDVQFRVLHYEFEARGIYILEEGWRSVRTYHTDEETEEFQMLPDLKKGDILEINKALAVEKQTKAPALHTEASLLSAMEHAGNKLDNKDQQKVLRNIGLGTPATRASIIETLFQRNYITRDKKSLVPTEKGLQLHKWIGDKDISNVAMTAEWELALADIENNRHDPALFRSNITEYTGQLTVDLLSLPIAKLPSHSLKCPKCKVNSVVIKDKLAQCAASSCEWKQWRNICGVQLSINDLELLLTQSKTSLIKGMKSKGGKIFDAYIVLKDDCSTSFEFGKRTSN